MWFGWVDSWALLSHVVVGVELVVVEVVVLRLGVDFAFAVEWRGG